VSAELIGLCLDYKVAQKGGQELYKGEGSNC